MTLDNRDLVVQRGARARHTLGTLQLLHDAQVVNRGTYIAQSLLVPIVIDTPLDNIINKNSGFINEGLFSVKPNVASPLVSTSVSVRTWFVNLGRVEIDGILNMEGASVNTGAIVLAGKTSVLAETTKTYSLLNYLPRTDTSTSLLHQWSTGTTVRGKGEVRIASLGEGRDRAANLLLPGDSHVILPNTIFLHVIGGGIGNLEGQGGKLTLNTGSTAQFSGTRFFGGVTLEAMRSNVNLTSSITPRSNRVSPQIVGGAELHNLGGRIDIYGTNLVSVRSAPFLS